MSDRQLVAQHLAKRFRRRWVVQDVSLYVRPGEVVGLLGPNGAGKTTSFYMIVGLTPADKGGISLDNQDITHQPLHARAALGLGYLPQEASVFRKLSVADNLMAVLEIREDLDTAGRKEEMERLLHEFRVAHLREQWGMSLSGGERRRVEIARALAAAPRYILLDEPFAGVDPLSVLDIQNTIKQLREQGIGVLITDHNVRETLGICERAYIISNGEVLAEGTPSAILENETVREVYLGKDFRL
ncbi:MAG: LPS export ABC transporter ATP-binding protein [Pseudomonadota bacterium]